MTNLETEILAAAAAASFNYDTAEAEKADNATIFTAAEIAEQTGHAVASVRGVMGSLHKKGLFCEIEEPNSRKLVSSFTDEGIDAYYAFAMPKASEETIFVTALELAAEQEELARNMGNPFPGIICSTIRAHAAGWEGTRKAFIEAGQAVGFNKHTLSTQWQRARGK